MGMVKIEIVRPKPEAHRYWEMRKRGQSDDLLEGDQVMRSIGVWNTRQIFMVAPVMGNPVDLPGAKSTFLTPLGEFQSPEDPWALASRVHDADARGVDYELCVRCAELSAETNEHGVCRKCCSQKPERTS